MILLLLKVTDFRALVPSGSVWTLSVLLTVVPVISVWCSVRRWSSADLGFIGLGRRGFHLFWQVPIAIVAALTATALVGTSLGLSPHENSSTQDAGTPIVAVVLLLAYLILGPIVEEVLVRRFTMYWLEEKILTVTGRPRLAVAGSVVLSSLVFALLHVIIPVILWTFFLGLGCAVLTRLHHSLWAGLILHTVNNLIASTALVAVMFGAG
ncbi:MAG TPA: CPBP family intramembrane metalloprotease [Candidatus Corynebacterium avicola]|uniref:CPBP family intramembrane metalloprotease n=1 Tax=Candidatus Corynebacterium avicola TaxID=2838527 RepID=A0A9D1ULN7_9CORY|nr:CPBP family intramembrane metalloprotease [Candidatus Corynebacterium avicola]